MAENDYTWQGQYMEISTVSHWNTWVPRHTYREQEVEQRAWQFGVHQVEIL
jgi:hypothetical protein